MRGGGFEPSFKCWPPGGAIITGCHINIKHSIWRLIERQTKPCVGQHHHRLVRPLWHHKRLFLDAEHGVDLRVGVVPLGWQIAHVCFNTCGWLFFGPCYIFQIKVLSQYYPGTLHFIRQGQGENKCSRMHNLITHKMHGIQCPGYTPWLGQTGEGTS